MKHQLLERRLLAAAIARGKSFRCRRTSASKTRQAWICKDVEVLHVFAKQQLQASKRNFCCELLCSRMWGYDPSTFPCCSRPRVGTRAAYKQDQSDKSINNQLMITSASQQINEGLRKPLHDCDRATRGAMVAWPNCSLNSLNLVLLHSELCSVGNHACIRRASASPSRSPTELKMRCDSTVTAAPS